MKSQLMFFLFTLLMVTNACEPKNTAKSSGSDTLQLNNGEKWNVNEEMTPYLKGMQGALLSYDVAEGDYTMLAETLHGYNKKLIKSCTMDGKSHDQLHVWLHPYLELTDALSKAKTADDAAQIVLKIKSSFETFNQHFQ